MDRGEGQGRQNREKSISRPSVSFLWYELVQIFPFSLSHKGMVHSTPITETPRKRDCGDRYYRPSWEDEKSNHTLPGE